MTQGVVRKIFDRQFGNKTVYSFTLNGDQTFYRLGDRPPNFSEGDSVKFEPNTKGANTYANGVVPWKEDGTPVTGRAVSSVAAKASNKDDFWERKELRDISVQKRIEIQSCRNSAIDLVRLLLQTGVEAVKLPSAQAKREAIVAEIVRKYTADFLKENTTGPVVDDSADVPAAAVPAETLNNKQEEEWS